MSRAPNPRLSGPAASASAPALRPPKASSSASSSASASPAPLIPIPPILPPPPPPQSAGLPLMQPNISSSAAVYSKPALIPPTIQAAVSSPALAAAGLRTPTPATLASPAPPPPPGSNSKDGLIRMLLQSAQPTLPPSMPPPPASTGTVALQAPSPQQHLGQTRTPPPSLPTTPLLPPPPPSSVVTPTGTPASKMAPTAVTPLSRSALAAGLQSQVYLKSPPPSEVKEDEKARNFIYQIEGEEREIGVMMLDHAYSRNWNFRPEVGSGTKPTRYLFVSRDARNQFPDALASEQKADEVINVTDFEEEPRRPYEPKRAAKRMDECERFVSFLNPEARGLDKADDWEERIPKASWTPSQHRVFNRMVKVLHADHLARLANRDVQNEPLLRRITVDKSAKRARQVLAGCAQWEARLTQWLHQMLVDHLPASYLACYLDIMQAMRARIPTLVEKMMAGKVYNEALETVLSEGIRILLNSKWDPATSALNDSKLKPLPGNPSIVLTPSGPLDEWSNTNPKHGRSALWANWLSQLATVLKVPPPQLTKETAGAPTRVGNYLNQLVTEVIAKIREVKKESGGRPILLVGWGVGAAVNCQAAAIESVAGCVCLGFPLFTMDGPRGDADDPILDLKSPVMFVVGDSATQCRADDVEDMRGRMRADTSMVVVGGADDHLRLSKSKKCVEKLTQSMVDRCIVDEVRDFCVGILTAPPPPMFALPAFIPSPDLAAPGGPGGLGSAAGTPRSTPGAAKKPAARRRKPQGDQSGSGQVPKRARKSAGGTKKALAASGPPPPLSASSSPVAVSNPMCSSAGPSPTPLTSGSITPASLPTTPLKPIGDTPKARKSLSMTLASTAPSTTPATTPATTTTTSSDNSTARMMASSPLLSSALTSPTKLPPPPPPPPTLPTQPTPPPPMPLVPPIQTAPPTSVSKNLLPRHPTPQPSQPPPLASIPPTLAAVLQQSQQQLQRPPPPIVKGLNQPLVVSSVPAASTKPVGSPVVSALTSATKIPGTVAPSAITVTAKTTTVTSASSTAAAPTQTRIATLPPGVNLAQVVKKAQQQQQLTSASGASGAGSGRENLYVISMPPDHVKSLTEKSNLVQYATTASGHMVTLVGADKTTALKAAAAAAISQHQQQPIVAAAAPRSLVVTPTTGPASTSGSTTPSPAASLSGPGTPTADKRNVAEILASLSGLVPEPPSAAKSSKDKAKGAASPASAATTVHVAVKSSPAAAAAAAANRITVTKSIPACGKAEATTTTTTAAAAATKQAPTILASGSSSGRVVRVLQTGTGRPAISAALPAAPTASAQAAGSPATTSAGGTSMSSASATGGRSRKQVFVTNEEKPSAGSGATGDGKDKDFMERSLTSSLVEQPRHFEQDILEEDVSDMEYYPYQKKSKAKKVAAAAISAASGATATATTSTSSTGEQQQQAKKTLRSSSTRKSN